MHTNFKLFSWEISKGCILRNGERWHTEEKDPGDILHKFVEIFESKGWLNKKLRIKYQSKRYWVSCNRERFFTYQINENCGQGPGVPSWSVCLIKRDYVYDESEISEPTTTKLDAHDWLNIIVN